VVNELKKLYPVTQTHEFNNENTTYGDYISYNKNCYLCFDTTHSTDTYYSYDSIHSETCMDITYSGENQLCYEVVDSGQCFNSNYIVYSANTQESSYIFNCADIKNC